MPLNARGKMPQRGAESEYDVRARASGTHPKIVLHFAAPNTPNGNPNRIFVVIDVVTDAVLGVFDEGYQGGDAVPAVLRGGGVYTIRERINVKAAEIRRWKQMDRS